MKQFRVRGVDRQTAEDRSIVVDAESEDEAVQEANKLGVMVASVHRMDTGEEAQRATATGPPCPLCGVPMTRSARIDNATSGALFGGFVALAGATFIGYWFNWTAGGMAYKLIAGWLAISAIGVAFHVKRMPIWLCPACRHYVGRA
jgi:hypothetical protein